MARYNTFQDAFGKVWEYFVVERHPQAMADDGYCAWFVPATGDKCAIGCLMTDEEASESRYYNELELRDFMRGRAIIPEGDAWFQFLNLLQAAHDDYEPSDGDFHAFIETRLRVVANEYKLAVPGEAMNERHGEPS